MRNRHPVYCDCLTCRARRANAAEKRREPLRLVTHLDDHADNVLRMRDRAADARARMYGYEIDALIQVAEACGLDGVPICSLRMVVDRMLDRNENAPTGATLDGKHTGEREEVTH